MIRHLLPLAELEKAYGFIQKSSRLVILTHKSSDGDAVGSTTALCQFVKTIQPAGATTKIVILNELPPYLSWFPSLENAIFYDDNNELAIKTIEEADCIICSDFNQPSRIGAPLDACLLANPCPKIMLDHHLKPESFTDVEFSYPDASSACEVVFRFIYQIQTQILNTPFWLTKEMAISIYACILTDTGAFSYNSNSPELFEMVGMLLNCQIEKDVIYDRIFNTFSISRMRLFGYCLHKKMQINKTYHLSLIYLTHEELARFNFQSGDLEGLVNYPLQIEKVYYSVLMRADYNAENQPIVRLSFRSQGNRPVNEFAKKVFGGGGHLNASGGEFLGTIKEALALFKAEYPKYLQKK